MYFIVLTTLVDAVVELEGGNVKICEIHFVLPASDLDVFLCFF